MKQWILILALLLAFQVSLPAQKGTKPASTPTPVPDPPKPNVSISFERQAIRENDVIQVYSRFSNEWDYPLSGVTLHIDGPASMFWNDSTCAHWRDKSYSGGLTNNMVDLGPINPHEVKLTRLCVRSGSTVDVGDFNVSFTYDYAWKKADRDQHSFITTDKTLKSNLFGSDAVAGVPIALAAFIVPGLFFWLVLGWLKFPWNIGGVGLGDKLIYSVLTSVPLLIIVNWLIPSREVGISVGKLGWYATIGFSTGLVIGSLDCLRRWDQRRRAEKKQKAEDAAKQAARDKEVHEGDTWRVVLEKVLNRYPDYHNPKAVVQVQGSKYTGSLAVENEEVVAIIGWFQIVESNIAGPNQAAILVELSKANRSLDRLRVAQKYNLDIDVRNPIEKAGDPAYVEKVATFANKDARVVLEDAQGSEETVSLQ